MNFLYIPQVVKKIIIIIIIKPMYKHKAAGEKNEAKQCKQLRGRFMRVVFIVFWKKTASPRLESYGQALEQARRFTV